MRGTIEGLDSDTAIAVLQNLQQGVPPEPEHVQYIRVGREEEEHRLCDKPIEGMQSVKRGGGDLFFVLGEFGYGKSFFINILARRAGGMGMVRSRFDLQDVQDIADKTDMYAKIVKNLRYPDQRGQGLQPLLRRFCEEVGPTEFDEIATRRNLFGHPIYTMLSRLLEAWSTGSYDIERDDVTYDRGEMLNGVTNYLQAEEVPLETLHAVGKKGYDHIGDEDEDDYLKHVRSLLLELGYEGLVVLLDEAAERLEWSPDSDTTQRLIGLVNKTHQQGEFEHTMFVFVGNQDKWDELVADTGHQALEQRYEAKKLVLSSLTVDDYVQLVRNVGRIVETGLDKQGALTDDEARAIVDDAVDAWGSVESLRPRQLLLSPEGEGGDRNLVDLIDERI